MYDECHHTTSAGYRFAADSCSPLSPRVNGDLNVLMEGRSLSDLIGPQVYRKSITELSGIYLAEYETIRIAVDLTPSERDAYEEARQIYRGFVRDQGIRMSSPSGWGEFVQRSARSQAGERRWRPISDSGNCPSPPRLSWIIYSIYYEFIARTNIGVHPE